MKNIEYRDHAFRVSLYASTISVLIMLSFRDYFFYVPFQRGVDFLTVMGAFAQVGWVALLVGPPLLLSNRLTRWTSSRKWLLIGAASLYPLTTLIIKIYGLSVTGNLGWASYLIIYPALFFIEWVLPVYYVLLSLRLAKGSTARRAVSEAASEAKVTFPQA